MFAGKSIYRSANFAALVAWSIWAFSQAANAATVSITNEVFTGNAPLFDTPTPASQSGTFSQSVIGSIPSTVPPANWLLPGGPSRVQLSPYAFNTGPGPDGSAAATNASYSGLDIGGDGGSSVTYNVNSSSFRLLWGSPDLYNEVEFFSEANGTGSPEGAFNGTNLACGSSSCADSGFDLVTFAASSGDIGSAALTDTGPAAFEFGINPASAVPLPASIYLFASVLGGAFWMSRKKRPLNLAPSKFTSTTS
jgi:hypothetical protein